MNGREILSQNHDIHMHTRHFSDGWHTVEEVIAHGLRRLEGEPWLGISEHSPLLEKILQSLGVEDWRAEAAAIRSSDFGIPDPVRAQMDARVRDYVQTGRAWRDKSSLGSEVSLLVGLEVDWIAGGPAVGNACLSELDYVLMAYHGNGFSDPRLARQLLLRMIRHPYGDVLAHPDAFLGPAGLDGHAWAEVFQEMGRRGVLCEYNLTTPLRPEILDMAATRSDVKFVIGSDLHDFRQRSTRRIMNAWAESEGGGFRQAFSYLKAILEKEYKGDRLAALTALFDSPQNLRDLEKKIYLSRRRINPERVIFSKEECLLLNFLDEMEDDNTDRLFLEFRLERFSSLPRDRLASLWSKKQFTDYIETGRRRRFEEG